MKVVVRILHLPSYVQFGLYEATGTLFVSEENKNNNFIIYLAVYGTVTSLPVFIQNILNCVPKTNEAFTGLERHGGK